MNKIVLFLSQSLSPGGSERRMVNLACLFKEKGYDVRFICMKDGDFYKSRLDEMKIPVEIIYGSILNPFAVIRAIRNLKPYAVISLLETPNIINCMAAALKHSWVSITGESSSFNELHKELSLLHVMRGKFMGWMMRFCDCLVCNSEHAKSLWIKAYPNYKGKVKTIYNPVILGTIDSDYIPLSNHKCHIVVAASFQYLKNPIGLIHAVTKMQHKENIIIDWYGGKANAYEDAVKLLDEQDLGDTIRLHGPTKDIHNIMNQADAVALFSRVEGLPNAICEAMMIGKPIVMTRVSDYSRLVTEANGFLCDWNDIDSIAAALDKVASLSAEALQQMGKQSQAIAKTLFKLDTIENEWLETIASKHRYE